MYFQIVTTLAAWPLGSKRAIPVGGVAELRGYIRENIFALDSAGVCSHIELVNPGCMREQVVPYRMFRRFLHGYLDHMAMRKSLNEAYFCNRVEYMRNC